MPAGVMVPGIKCVLAEGQLGPSGAEVSERSVGAGVVCGLIGGEEGGGKRG